MAEEKKSFPMLPIGHWWELRKKFKQSIPGVVTDSYLATVLDMQPVSARANVLPFLKQLAIIDEDGKTGERAKVWRDDEHYPGVCKSIVGEVYPTELKEAVPNPTVDRVRAERWFAQKTGAGDAAVKRMAALYAVLVEADASKQPDEKIRKSAEDRPPREKKTPMAAIPAATLRARQQEPGNGLPRERAVPGININLQVHISADSSSDQIDQIFASMAKHIYQRD
jgi:hypothetical protein